MKISEILKNKKTLSFEVFPPKTTDKYEIISNAIKEIASLNPSYMSVTYGAGGGTSEFTSQIAPQNIKYVGGSVWLASTVGVYSPAKPQVMFLMHEKENPWIDINDIKSKGILVIDENPIMYQNYQKIFPNLPNPQVYVLTVKSLSGKVKKYNIYYGTITGEQNER